MNTKLNPKRKDNGVSPTTLHTTANKEDEEEGPITPEESATALIVDHIAEVVTATIEARLKVMQKVNETENKKLKEKIQELTDHSNKQDKQS